MFTDGRGKRPTRAELHQIEAVLRALADTGEDELDSGRWTKAVTTAAGPRSLTLTLPLLIEAESRAGSPHRRGARGAGAEPALARIAAFMSGKEFDSTAAANEALNHALRLASNRK